MEFFQQIDNPALDAQRLKAQLTVGALPALCRSIDRVLTDNLTDGVIYCLWGQFRVNREELQQGIRFSMPDCPNALAWTVTVNSVNDPVVVHCTINKFSHDDDFIESIQQFVHDWSVGIATLAADQGRPELEKTAISAR
jgi:hypothetical protein